MALREEEIEALKKKLQSTLRGKFNHAFNMKTIKKERGEILLERRPVTDFQLKKLWTMSNLFLLLRKKIAQETSEEMYQQI